MRITARTTILTLLALTATLLSTGCSGVRAPRFESAGVREVQRTDTRTAYAFMVQATNPNRDPIPLREVSYTVTLNPNSPDSHTFTGVRSPESTLHTYAKHTFELPAVFDLTPSELSGIIDYTITGSAKYLKPGKFNEVMFDSGINVTKAEFTLKGRVDVDHPLSD